MEESTGVRQRKIVKNDKSTPSPPTRNSPQSSNDPPTPSITSRLLQITLFISISAILIQLIRLTAHTLLPDVRKKSQTVLLEEGLRGLELGGKWERLVDDVEKKDAILNAIHHSWNQGYVKYAWGKDEFHPVSKSGSNLENNNHGIGYTIIDSLSTLIITNQIDEVKRCRDWIEFELDWNKADNKYNTFETTIRLLAGLLSAHSLTQNNPLFEPDPIYLEKARDLGDRILAAFDTPSGLPLSNINIAKSEGIPDWDNRGLVSLAEVGTLQLEFKYLSEQTQNPIYWKKVSHIMNLLNNTSSNDGLLPIFLNPNDEKGAFVFSEIRLGSRGDSYYEYLLKQYLQTNRTEPIYRKMYDQAMNGIKLNLIKVTTKGDDLVYTVEIHPIRAGRGKGGAEGGWSVNLVPKQDHLVCFLPGLFLLGVTEGQHLNLYENEVEGLDDFYLGHQILRTCWSGYDGTKTGLAAEIVHFINEDQPRVDGREWFIKRSVQTPIDARYILRPETVESLFLAYRVTHNPVYRKWGWKIFQSLEKHCKVPSGGYTGIKDVDELPVRWEDKMETFWMSETLKYLYLLFSDEDTIPIDKWVFNTEGHPLPIFTPTVVPVGPPSTKNSGFLVQESRDGATADSEEEEDW